MTPAPDFRAGAGAAPPDLVAFLVRAAREFTGVRSVFTGFHWPLIAARLARRLDAAPFTQVLEAGAALAVDTPELPTSTTDYAALDGASSWLGSTSDVLRALARRTDRVLLDAANVDLAGCVNSTAIGSLAAPRVRLPGSGGAADAGAAARELVLLHGGTDPRRLQARVEHVTVRPGTGATIRLVGRFGVLGLGDRPRLLERAGATAAGFLDRMRELGVELDGAHETESPTPEEARAAAAVLAEAAARGYVAAAAARGDWAGAPGAVASGDPAGTGGAGAAGDLGGKAGREDGR